jgi:hypothetical protein
MDPAITMLRDTLSKLSSINSDETRARATAIQSQLDAAVQKKADILKKFDDSIQGLIAQEQSVVTEFTQKIAA